MTIETMPPELRPRERLLAGGPGTLNEAELLALILGEGTRGRSSLRVAEGVLVMLGGVKGLHDSLPAELAAVPGIGPAKAARLVATAELARRLTAKPVDRGRRLLSSAQVTEWFTPMLSGRRKEEFWTVLLDAANRVVGKDFVSLGSQTQTVVHPREVFRSAVKRGAAGVIVVHNHPGGDPEPSPEDRALTARLVRAGQVLGIPVLDHVIITDSGHFSFADRRELG